MVRGHAGRGRAEILLPTFPIISLKTVVHIAQLFDFDTTRCIGECPRIQM